MKALVLAALVAYIPTSVSLFKRAAARPASGLSKVREVTLTGNVTVKDQGEHAAQLVLRFPLSCKLEGEGGVSLSVRGTPAKPNGVAEGTTGPALLQARVAAEISELHPGPLQKPVIRCQRPVPKMRSRYGRTRPRRDRIVITLC